MSFASFASNAIHLLNDRVSKEDARRQEAAAAEILGRLARQPGVILADEVGMGKTFVALATAVSVILERPDADPVVVMCPPTLREKWPKDWAVFREKCLAPGVQNKLRASSANSGVEFLRLLDDPSDTRSQLIFLTHGALHRAVGDGFIKLAMIKRAFKNRSSLAAQRANFPRFAARLLRMEWAERHGGDLLGDLLERPYETWWRTIQRDYPSLAGEMKDDPAPKQFIDALEGLPASELEEVVAGLHALPLRETDRTAERLRDARQGIAKAMETVWKSALRRAEFRSPLLILDEAHHVKNPATRLASLFATEESVKDSEYFTSAGPLGGKFERMLFLTATPFQLGHAECGFH